MSNFITGTVSFIHHEKNYATIDYELNGKKKSINGNIDVKEQEKWKEQQLIKKIHHFNIGDVVSFLPALTPRGDRMTATQIRFLYNNALDNILQKAKIENKFAGYLKKVDEHYFVKETGSYILFPLELSPWEHPPKESLLNEAVFFSLEKSTAHLFKHDFIPEYKKAMDCFRNKTVIEATVTKVSPHGIFISFFGKKMSAKIPVKDANEKQVQTGDSIKIRISFLGLTKIVVEKAD